MQTNKLKLFVFKSIGCLCPILHKICITRGANSLPIGGARGVQIEGKYP